MGDFTKIPQEKDKSVMNERKATTKEILQMELAGQMRTPLYNRTALEKIRKEFDKWWQRSRYKNKRNWLFTPQTILGSGIAREMLYTPLSNQNLDYTLDLGLAGEEPFTRGIHPNMYRGKKFTMRQLTGFGGPEETNERIKG